MLCNTFTYDIYDYFTDRKNQKLFTILTVFGVCLYIQECDTVRNSVSGIFMQSQQAHKVYIPLTKEESQLQGTRHTFIVEILYYMTKAM